MFGQTRDIYLATRKKHDLVFNVYFMRPIAAAVVALAAKTPVTPNQLTLLNLGIFLVSAALFVALPTWQGALVAVGVLELSYCFDCADGMLARHKKIASKQGHLFDFFTDELKATVLASVLAVRLFRTGGRGIDLAVWPPESPKFLFAGIAAAVIISGAISLTNFIRRPELSGKETTVEAHYETVEAAKPKSLVGRAAGAVMTFLQFLNHYPSHIWIWVFFDRLDAFFWLYAGLNALYLGRGWLGLLIRFGAPAGGTSPIPQPVSPQGERGAGSPPPPPFVGG